MPRAVTQQPGPASDAGAYITPLEDITDTSAGGKAYGLARLVAMGLPVPPAFVLRNASGEAFPDALDEHYAGLGSARVAVRSSAQGEDGDEASFAGQYDTVLNVEGAQDLRRAIRHCVASAANERAGSYRQEQADGGAVAMNIVVQAMVDARGYIVRSIDEFPKQGKHLPWRVYQNFIIDFINLRFRPLRDKVLQFR